MKTLYILSLSISIILLFTKCHPDSFGMMGRHGCIPKEYTGLVNNKFTEDQKNGKYYIYFPKAYLHFINSRGQSLGHFLVDSLYFRSDVSVAAKWDSYVTAENSSLIQIGICSEVFIDSIDSKTKRKYFEKGAIFQEEKQLYPNETCNDPTPTMNTSKQPKQLSQFNISCETPDIAQTTFETVIDSNTPYPKTIISLGKFGCVPNDKLVLRNGNTFCDFKNEDGTFYYIPFQTVIIHRINNTAISYSPGYYRSRISELDAWNTAIQQFPIKQIGVGVCSLSLDEKLQKDNKNRYYFDDSAIIKETAAHQSNIVIYPIGKGCLKVE
ncbi:MAG: hypothetical protein ABJC12_11565 [Saprospiraceae bacterium]